MRVGDVEERVGAGKVHDECVDMKLLDHAGMADGLPTQRCRLGVLLHTVLSNKSNGKSMGDLQ